MQDERRHQKKPGESMTLETEEKTRKDVARWAVDAFNYHSLTQVSEERWRVQTPGTWSSGFFVILAPGVIIVYGDIGEGIFCHSDHDSLAWLRRAVQSPDYLLSKLK